MGDHVLTGRELNRALLARQGLLERAPLPVSRALERVGGLQTQYAPSGYIGLWSRVEGFTRDRLNQALERRTVVQATLMRSTIHLVSARDYPLLTAGIRRARQAWWLRAHPGAAESLDAPAIAARVRAALAEGPRRSAELAELLEPYGPLASQGAGIWVDLLRAPPGGTWEQRRADVIASAEQWLGHSAATEAKGLELIVRRYLGAFGPAGPAEIASWAGVDKVSVTAALARVRLRRFRDEGGRELVDLPRAPLPPPETPAPVRFLPKWDAVLLSHARRTGILPERHYDLAVNRKNLDIAPTFLVDGFVAGRWRYERGRVLLEPFEPLSRSVRLELEEEAERLAAFHA